MKRMRTPLKMGTLLVVVLAALLFTIRGSYAWFTDKDGLSNQFNFDFEYTPEPFWEVILDDEFDQNEPWGPELEKKVGATNTGTIPAVLRILAHAVIVKDDIPMPLDLSRMPSYSTYNAASPEPFYCDLRENLDTSGKWFEDGKGYYYYAGVLEPGEPTPYLFTYIRTGQTGNYQGATLKVYVQVEAVDASEKYRKVWWSNSSEYLKPIELETIDNAIKKIYPGYVGE